MEILIVTIIIAIAFVVIKNKKSPKVTRLNNGGRGQEPIKDNGDELKQN